MEVNIGKFLTCIQISRMIGHCILMWIYSHKRKFKIVISVTSVFFAFMFYFISNPLNESCKIHLSFGAVGRHHDVSGITLIVTSCTVIFLSRKDLLLYCGLRSTSEDLVQVDAVPVADRFLWPQSVFKELKKVILKLQWPVRYHPLMSSVAEHHFCLSCSFYQRV